ncbi:MAG: hypothetical protein EOO70_04245, partial [Myxococcaceae bacterium]
MITATLAAMLLATTFSACDEDAPKPKANPQPMAAAAYKQAVKAMRDVARQTPTSPGDGRLVGAVKPKDKVFLITSAGNDSGSDLCLRARIYGTQQRAFLDTPRTELPTSKPCNWFLE